MASSTFVNGESSRVESILSRCNKLAFSSSNGNNFPDFFSNSSCLCYGSVDLTPKAAPQEAESYTTTHHDKPMYIHNDMTMVKMMVPAEVINHTDEELTLLEGLVGRVTPFYGTGKKY